MFGFLFSVFFSIPTDAVYVFSVGSTTVFLGSFFGVRYQGEVEFLVGRVTSKGRRKLSDSVVRGGSHEFCAPKM